MRISDVLRGREQRGVVTVRPDTTVQDFLALMAEYNIGACIVSVDGKSVDGIVSERDVVRALVGQGVALLSEPVSTIATLEVHTADPDTHIDDLMRMMTEERIRHVPVVVKGGLTAIVSIGDVVKRRIDELEVERQHLVDYISSAQ
jgi:CBS domain-containing protein